MAVDPTNDGSTDPKEGAFANGEVVIIEGEEHIIIKEDEVLNPDK
ncbi:hypothetical protein [Streptomyces sp. NPDC002403]